MKLNREAFTLIELMIVVTIIGLLAAVATPRFARMLKRAKQASSKNGLAVLRSAAGVYYADNLGTFAYEDTAVGGDYSFISALDSISNNAFTPKYLSIIPDFISGIQGYPNENSNEIAVAEDGGTFDYDSRGVQQSVAAPWVYFKKTGMWYVNCGELDTTGVAISTW